MYILYSSIRKNTPPYIGYGSPVFNLTSETLNCKISKVFTTSKHICKRIMSY